MVPDYLPQQAIPSELLSDISRMIEETRSAMAVTVNVGLTLLYWRIGKRIAQEILKGKRAEYGQEIVPTLSAQLVPEFGTGFGVRNLFRMIKFAEVFPDEKIVSTLSTKLSWSNFVEIIPLKDELQRNFYAEMCRIEQWSVRALREKISGMLFERTVLSRKPAELAKQELDLLREEDKLTPDLVFRDPYLLDFLNLKDTYSEHDLEAAILREIESFLLELGYGFTFVARQKRMVIDNQDFYLDLLFFHRKLKRLVAVELKLDRFKAAFKGQMELYLRWLEKYEMEADEASPLGLILCAEGSRETIELLRLDASGIHVAEYMTELPPREDLKKKLHSAIQLARSQAGRRSKIEEG